VFHEHACAKKKNKKKVARKLVKKSSKKLMHSLYLINKANKEADA